MAITYNPADTWETDGTRNGYTVYCPTCAYGDCPYCDQEGICHIADPVEECDDFGSYYESWDEYEASESYNEDEDEDWEPDDSDLELGFNPYMGGYDYDC